MVKDSLNLTPGYKESWKNHLSLHRGILLWPHPLNLQLPLRVPPLKGIKGTQLKHIRPKQPNLWNIRKKSWIRNCMQQKNG